MNISHIQKYLEPELIEFDKRFRATMTSSIPLLDKVTRYIVKRKGKQMRPMFVFLSAKLAGETNNSTYTAAGLIELLHTATLVHDDVVDEADERRGFFSLNALWKNKISVLVGDFLLSRGLISALETKEYTILEIATKAVKEMSEGELLQLEKARNFNATEAVYYEIIRKKTASLVSACCSSGIYSSTKDEVKSEIMWKFGELVGIAFQIQDDIFDYNPNSKAGKPSGNDLKEQKFTLPLIHALAKSSKSERNEVIQIIKTKKITKEKIEKVRNFVIDKGGIEYSKNKMEELVTEAKKLLISNFDDSQSRTYILELVDYTITRNH